MTRRQTITQKDFQWSDTIWAFFDELVACPWLGASRLQGIVWDVLRVARRLRKSAYPRPPDKLDKGLIAHIREIVSFRATPCPRERRTPFTPQLLFEFYSDPAVDRGMATAAVVGFFGLLRPCEMAAAPHYRPEHIPMRRYFSRVGVADRAAWLYRIFHTKTTASPFDQWVTVSATGRPLCPATALDMYVAWRDRRFPDKAAMFLTQAGFVISTTKLSQTIKDWGEARGINHLTAYSCRIGGATTMAAAGISHDRIQLHGRWAQGSGTFRRYIRPMLEASSARCQRMADVRGQPISAAALIPAFEISLQQSFPTVSPSPIRRGRSSRPRVPPAWQAVSPRTLRRRPHHQKRGFHRASHS